MKYLFIGGCADGEWHEVSHPPPPSWRLASKERIAFAPGVNDSTVPFSTFSYKREVFRDCCGSEYTVYLHGDVARPIALILHGYAALRRRVQELEEKYGCYESP